MTAIDMSQLSNIANISLEDFKQQYSQGVSIAGAYYTELANQATLTGNLEIGNYAQRAYDVASNSGLQGRLGNAYSEQSAHSQGVHSFYVGSDDWLEMQYSLMQRDFSARDREVFNGKTGYLGRVEIDRIHELAFGEVGLSSETFTTHVILEQMEEQLGAAFADAAWDEISTGSGLLELVGDAFIGTLSFPTSLQGVHDRFVWDYHIVKALAYVAVDVSLSEFQDLIASLQDYPEIVEILETIRGDSTLTSEEQQALILDQITESAEEGIVIDTLESQVSFSQTYPISFVDENGQLKELTLNPAERKVANYDLRISDFETNGTIISETSGTTTLYGSTFDFTETVRELNGEQQKVVRFELPSGGVFPSNGVREQIFYSEIGSDGQFYVAKEETQFVDAAGRTHDTLEYRDSEDGNWMVRETINDPLLQTSSESPLYIVPSTDLLQTLQFTGGTVGSLLGNHLADDSAYKAVIYSAFFKTVGEHFGTFASYLAVENNLANSLDVAVNGGSIQGTAFENQAFSETFVENLQASASSALAGVIVDEVGEALGIEGTIVGEIFDATATTVTTGIISGGIDILFNNLDGSAYAQILQAGFDFDASITLEGGQTTTVGDYLQAQVLNAFASYVGGRLAGEVIEAESEAAALFGAAGSAFGTAIASGAILTQTAVGGVFKALGAAGWAGGPLGVAIGAFVGQVAGTLLGNAFGGEEEPISWSHLAYNKETGQFYVGSNWGDNGGDAGVALQLGNQVIDGINNIIEASHGKLRSGVEAPRIQIGLDGGEYMVAIDGSFQSFGTAAEAVHHATFYMMQNFDLVGGHMVMMRAWHNSDASNIYEMLQDIQVAEAFQQYLVNPAGILALMMDQPDSDLAQSWAAILQRAAELELHLPHEKDLDGGWGEILLAQGVDSEFIPDLSGDTLTVIDPVTGEETVMHHVIGPGYEIVRIEGTDGNDIIEVIVDGPSITYVNAADGDDTIEGGDGSDILVGGGGDDTINGNDGNDWLHGGSGDDTIDGGAGEDLVIGGQNNDYLLGSDDNDHIHGNDGDDYLFGNDGQDFLFGGNGNDVLHANAGTNDELYGGAGDDVLYGGGNWQYLYGEAGDDTYIIQENDNVNSIRIARNEGHDVVQGVSSTISFIQFSSDISLNELHFQQNSDDLIISVLGEDQSVTVKDFYASDVTIRPNIGIAGYTSEIRAYHPIESSWRSAILQLVANDNTITETLNGDYNVISDAALSSATSDAESTNVWQITDNLGGFISGTDAGETLSTTPSVGIIYAGAGNDTLSNYGGGFAALFGDSGDDTVHGSIDQDLLVGGLGDDTVYGYSGDDELYGGHGQDTLQADAGEDYLSGGAGNDILLGGAGNDTIEGDDGIDTIDAGAGNDTVRGGLGNDIIDGGDDHDTIYGDEGDDTVDGGDGIDTVFGGSGNDTIAGGIGNDWLSGEDGNDIITGGEGDDVVNGGEGDDILRYYHADNLGSSDQYQGGAGSDKVSLYFSIAEYANAQTQRDILRFNTTKYVNSVTNPAVVVAFTFALFGLIVEDVETLEVFVDDVLQADVSFVTQVGSDADETLSATTAEHAVLIGQEGNDILNGNVGDDDLRGGLGDDVLNASAGSDIAYGDHGDDQIAGDAGEDFLYGGDGNDIITGGTEADFIEGGDGDDDLAGDEGDDTLLGGDGDDTYQFNIGDGLDVYDDEQGDYDVIQFGAGIVFSDLIFEKTNGVDLVINFSGQAGDQITIRNHFLSGSTNAIEKLIFSNGAQFDLTSLSLNSAPDAKDDAFIVSQFVPLSGNVLFDNGAGVDSDFEGDPVSVVSGVYTTAQGGSVEMSDDGSFTYIPSQGFFGSDSFSYTLIDDQGGSSIGNVSITVNQLPEVIGTSADDNLNGTAGNEALYGFEGDDTIHAQAGNDVVFGGEGIDVLYGDAGDDYIEDTDYNAALGATTYQTTFYGGTGNDTLIGGEGRHLYYDGYGGATYNYIEDRGSTDDWYAYMLGGDLVEINDMGGNGDYLSTPHPHSNQLYFNNTTFERLGNDDLVIQGGNGGAHLILVDQFTDLNNVTGVGIEQLWINYQWEALKPYLLNYSDVMITRGSAADDIINGIQIANPDDEIYAGAGDDTISGDAGNDVLLGEAGNDTLSGGAGNDTLNGGLGVDTIDYSAAAAGIVASLHANSVSNDGDGGVDTLSSIENVTGSGFADIITGSDGANVIVTGEGGDIVQGRAGDDIITGSSGVDILYGGNDNDTIYAGAGDDTDIQGDAGDDILFGQSGNDTLRGGLGNDTLDGGDDDDVLIGNEGDDTFIVSNGMDLIDGGHGIDTLDYSTWGQGVTVNLFSGTVDKNGDSVTDDAFIFTENFIGTDYDDTITGSDGVNVIHGGGGNDLIYARSGTDILYGDDGDDIIWGVGGDDVLYGGAGADTLRGQAGADTFVFLAGDAGSVDTIEDFSVAQGDKLDISDVLIGYDPTEDVIADFIQITDNGADTTVAVDVNGGGDNFVQIATLLNITGLTDEAALETSGTLITA